VYLLVPGPPYILHAGAPAAHLRRAAGAPKMHFGDPPDGHDMRNMQCGSHEVFLSQPAAGADFGKSPLQKRPLPGKVYELPMTLASMTLVPMTLEITRFYLPKALVWHHFPPTTFAFFRGFTEAVDFTWFAPPDTLVFYAVLPPGDVGFTRFTSRRRWFYVIHLAETLILRSSTSRKRGVT
jgi:hypothetical protein